jgi:hypothetical protein
MCACVRLRLLLKLPTSLEVQVRLGVHVRQVVVYVANLLDAGRHESKLETISAGGVVVGMCDSSWCCIMLSYVRAMRCGGCFRYLVNMVSAK